MQERSARQDLECDKISLERQVRASLGDGSQEAGRRTLEGIRRELTVEASCPLSEQGLEEPVGQLRKLPEAQQQPLSA